MKRCYRLVTLFAICTFAALTNAQQQSSCKPQQGFFVTAQKNSVNQRYYVDPCLGLKLLIPKAWNVALAGEGFVVFGPKQPRSVNMSVGVPAEGTSLEVIREGLKQEGCHTSYEENVTAQGVEGVKIDSVCDLGAEHARVWTLLLRTGNKHYTVHAGAGEKEFPMFIPTFREMLGSLQFLDSQAIKRKTRASFGSLTGVKSPLKH